MARAIEWTEEMDATLREMRADRCTCDEIAVALEVSKNAVVNRLDRLSLPKGMNWRRLGRVPRPEDRDEEPLPAGHPVSWQAISCTPWPALR